MPATDATQVTVVPDAVLLERMAQQDSSALIELERRHRSSLYAQVYGVLWDSARTERVVANVFVQIWHAASRIVGKHTPWNWMRKTAAQLALEERATIRQGSFGGRMVKRFLVIAAALIVPAALSAQSTPPTIPNEHASATGKARATRVRGEAVGLDNRPVTPATPAVRATRATPAVPNPDGGPATRATPATPATPAVPASPSRRPENPGAGHGRRP